MKKYTCDVEVDLVSQNNLPCQKIRRGGGNGA